MTEDDRQALYEIAKRSNIEAVVIELSAICSWQSIRNKNDKVWRSAELKLDRCAQNLPLNLRNASWQPRKVGDV